MGCPPVRGDNPRALGSGLSYVQVDKHGITILYHLHRCRPCTSRDIPCWSWYGWYKAVKNLLSSTVKRYMREPVKIYSGLLKNSGEIIDKLKASDFNETRLSTSDFSTLYTTLPYNLTTDKLIDLIDKPSIEKAHLILHVTTETQFVFRKNLKKHHAWSYQNVCDALTFLLDNIFIRFGTKKYRQVVGIPTNCAPLVAD